MNMMTKVLCASVMCVAGFNAANAAPAKKATARMGGEEQKQLSVCAKKSAGAPVMYSYGGITFNGYCQPNANGKLQFMPPMPNGQMAEAVTQ